MISSISTSTRAAASDTKSRRCPSSMDSSTLRAKASHSAWPHMRRSYPVPAQTHLPQARSGQSRHHRRTGLCSKPPRMGFLGNAPRAFRPTGRLTRKQIVLGGQVDRALIGEADRPESGVVDTGSERAAAGGPHEATGSTHDGVGAGGDVRRGAGLTGIPREVKEQLVALGGGQVLRTIARSGARAAGRWEAYERRLVEGPVSDQGAARAPGR